MIFGHNSNIVVGNQTVHVQTEDRGAASAIIDTTVHWKGRVLHRRTEKYTDLLPLDATREAEVKTRLDAQHQTVLDEIRNGVLRLPLEETPKPAAAPPAVPAKATLRVELANPKAWLQGKHASLQVKVSDSGQPVGGADVRVRIEGAESPLAVAAKTAPTGLAALEFDMPALLAGAALVVEARAGERYAQQRFQLQVKSKGEAQ
ncbi:MAG TPA: hypothetical protein VMT51_12425 [Dongiaceae bacterium]|nr:hypothetical protein [Dongiaceae bacterium]